MMRLPLLTAAAAAGAGLGLLGGGVAWGAAGALALPLLALAEASWWRRRDGLEPRWLPLGYLPGALLFLLPILSRAVPPPWEFPERLPELVHRTAAGVLLLGALILGLGVRAWAFLSLPGRGQEGAEAREERGWRRVALGAAACALLFGAMSCLACRAFHKYVDLANDNEVVMRLSRGEGPVCYLPEPYPSYPKSCVYWAQHFTVMWALVAPLYRLWPGPSILLLLQAALVSATVLPIFGALRGRLGGGQAAGVALAFLLYPTTQHAMLHEVHGLSLAVPFTAALWWAVRARRWGYAAAAALLALSCREDVSFVLAGLGLSLLFERGRRMAGLLLLLASAAWFLYLIDHLMPSLGGDRDWRTYKFSSLGASHPEILRTLLTRPLFVLGLYLTPAKLGNVAVFLLPLAGLPLLGGRTSLVAVPLFLAIFLSDSTPAYSYLLFYTLPAVPFLFLGAGEALMLLERRWGRRLRDAAWLTFMGASLFATVLFGPSPLGRTFWQRSYILGDFAEPYHHRSVYAQTEHARLGHRILERIPADSVVAAQAFFLPHLAHVRRMKNLPEVAGADYVLLDTSHPNRYELRTGNRYEPFVRSLREDPSWICLVDKEGYLLFKRRRP